MRIHRLTTLFALFLFFYVGTLPSQAKDEEKTVHKVFRIKTIVIDAGHGGRDFGAKGHSSYEKNITLQVALKLGKAIQRELPGVQVIYTRSSDVFVPLYERIGLANQKKADLFISIHCNSTPSKRYGNTGRGTETFVSGSGRLGEQEAAMRENASLLLEENYQENYDGFDPNDPESYIILSLMKSTYRNQSIKLASFIQDQFVKAGRENRGVKEQSLAVLARAGMPAVLTEIGFISSPTEERYLNSAGGQAEIVRNLLDAVKAYKKQAEN